MIERPESNRPGRTLVLIRHATPEIDFDRPPATWELSPQGVAESLALARDLAGTEMSQLYASTEPKAASTAQKLAGALNIGWQTWPNLHEHERGALPEYGHDEWHSLIRRCLEHPEQIVLGEETAARALARFTTAVEAVLRDSTAQTVGVVSHGTVMSIYASTVTGKPAYDIWIDLGMPDYVVLNFP